MIIHSENVNMSSTNSAEISGSPSPAPSSVGNNAPKYGTLVPNRVFVGGISASTTEQDLLELFSKYGTVKATKIISDRAGVSKGYGFVTFETEEEARRLTQEADNIMLKDRKLNIAPAIKKQVSDVGYLKTYSPRGIENSGSVVGGGGTVFFSSGASYPGYGSTVPVLAPTEYHTTFPQAQAPAPSTPSAYHPTTIMYAHQPLYYPQQYQYHQPTQQQQQSVGVQQWGTPQWRWLTPASYPQPECGPQVCLADRSNSAQEDLTTTSTKGSPPSTSTPPSTEACPSTPTTTTATTTVCTSVKTISTTTTNTTMATGKSTASQAVRPPDSSVLQIKPLTQQPGKAATARPRATLPPAATHNKSTTIWADKNNNTTEGSKVGGGGSNGRPASLQQPPHPGATSHFTSTKTIPSSTPSNTITTTSTSLPTTCTTTTHNNTTVNNGMLRKLEENGHHLVPREQGYNKVRNQDTMKSGSGNGPPASQVREGKARCQTDRSTGSNRGVGPGGWNGWQPVTTGKEGWRSHPVHSSYCPHYSGAMTYPYGNPVHMPTSHLVISPSWNSLGWPLPPSQTHSLRSPATNSTHTHPNITSPVWRPRMTYSPHTSSTPFSGIPVQQPSPASMSPATPQVTETLLKGFQNNTSAAPARDTVTCMTTVTSTSNNTTFTTPSSKTITSSSTPSRVVHAAPSPCYTPYPGSGVDQTAYGYVNQQHLLMMPYYQYGGTMAPYYHWPTPVMMQWPMTQSPTATLQCTPTQTSGTVASPKVVGGNCLPHTVLPFTTQSPRYNTFPSPQTKSTNLREGLQSPSCNSSPRPPPLPPPYRGSRLYFNRKGSYNGQPIQVASCRSSPTTTVCDRNGEQKLHKNIKPPLPASPTRLTSTRLVATSPYHFPNPLVDSPVQDASGRQFSDPCSEAGVQPWTQGPEDNGTLMPITPPPTPLLENDNAALTLNGS